MRTRPNLLAGEKRLPEPLQKRSREKRERLKTAALALFGEKGYGATSIDDISRRARLATGTFYQHYRSKRQLLLALMDELLQKLSQLDFRPQQGGDVRAGLRQLLARAFAADLRYLGAYRAWQEAILSDSELARKQAQIHAWTKGRVAAVFRFLQTQPGARRGIDIEGLVTAMDSFFWSLLARATGLARAELDQQVNAATHLIYHALFLDPATEKRR